MQGREASNESQYKQSKQFSNDDYSIQDLVKEFVLWGKIFYANYIKFILLGFIGGIVGFIYAYFDKPLYTANTRFMLKNEGVGSLFGGQMTGLTSLLGGGQMGTPLERTAEVIGSDRIIGRAMFRQIKVQDSFDLVINHFIRFSNIRKSWAKDSVLVNVKFDSNDNNLEDLSISQRKAYKEVKTIMSPERGTGIVRKSFDKKSGVLTLSCVFQDQDFAIELSKIIFNELSDFFIEQMTYTSSNNAQVMKEKVDSIRNELKQVRQIAAEQTDQSLGLLLMQDKVSLKELTVKEQMLNIMYSEAIKNYESFEFMNKAATPSLMLIDYPYAPIKPTKKNNKAYAIFFSFTVICISFIYYRVKFGKNKN